MLYGGANIFNHDNFVKNVEEPGVRQRTGRTALPRRRGLPGRQERATTRSGWTSRRALGLAWDVTGDGRLAFRTSYGLTYDFPSGDYMNINASAPPWGNRSLITTDDLRRSVLGRRRQPASDRDQREHGVSRRSARSA